jgi:pyrroline-5-carboxylate reductase
MLQCGATGMFANKQVTAANRALAESILSSVGITVWVDDETKLDAITAVSGRGPASYFLMMEAMTQAGIELGLDADVAQKLVTQTALGAAKMMAAGELDAATLRANVTSKGGTTEQAIAAFEQAGFRAMVTQALRAAHDRSITLADELAKDNQ